MGHTDPISGARYPDTTDDTNLSAYFQHLAADLSKVAGGIFATNAARDSAFANWTAAGNTMVDGLQCRVGGYPQVYRSGVWHGTTVIPYGTQVVDNTLYTTSQTLMTLSITDPLFPYRLQCSGQILFGTVGAGVTVGGRIRVNGSDLIVGNDAINSSGSTVSNLLTTIPTGTTGTLSGSSVVTVFVSKNGTAGNGYAANSTGSLLYYNALNVQLMPV